MFKLTSVQLALLKYAVVAVGAVLAVWFAYSWAESRGYARCELEHKAALAESLQRGLEQAREIAKQDAEIVESREIVRTRIVHLMPMVEEIKNEARTADDVAECQLSDDALRMLNESRGYFTDSTPADKSGVVEGLPSAPKADIKAPQRRGGTPLHGGPAVHGLRISTSLSGGSRESAGGI